MLYTRKSSVVLATVVALGVCGVGQIALLPEVNQVNVVQAARNEQVTYFMAKFVNSTSWNENSVVKIPESGEPTVEVAELKINFSLLGEQTFEAILKNPADHLNVTFENVPGMTFDFSQADVEASENACGNDFYTGSLTVSNIHESEFGRWNRYEVAPDSTEKIPGQTNATNQENTTLTGETGVLGTDYTVDVPPSNKNVTQSGKAAATKVNPKIKLAVAATSGLAEFNPAYLNEDKNTPSIKNTRKVPKPTSKHVTKSDVSVFGVGLLIALAVATGFTLTRKKWTS